MVVGSLGDSWWFRLHTSSPILLLGGGWIPWIRSQDHAEGRGVGEKLDVAPHRDRARGS